VLPAFEPSPTLKVYRDEEKKIQSLFDFLVNYMSKGSVEVYDGAIEDLNPSSPRKNLTV